MPATVREESHRTDIDTLSEGIRLRAGRRHVITVQCGDAILRLKALDPPADARCVFRVAGTEQSRAFAEAERDGTELVFRFKLRTRGPVDVWIDYGSGTRVPFLRSYAPAAAA